MTHFSDLNLKSYATNDEICELHKTIVKDKKAYNSYRNIT